MTHVRVQTPGVLCKSEFELKQLKRYEIAYTDVRGMQGKPVCLGLLPYHSCLLD